MSNKEIALQIINFLKGAVKENEVPEEYIDSIDVAMDCVADAFAVNKDDDAKAVEEVFKGMTLKQIVAEAKSQQLTSDAAEAAEVPVHVEEEETDEETKKKAEGLKLEGNKAMAGRDFATAVEKYTAAIDLTPKNKIYLSNRAAAYSSLGKHEEAIKDAKAAIEVDPTYSKAYSRLGLAYYALNKPREAMEAYKKGIDVEGETQSDAMKKGYETAKKRVEESLGLDTAESSAAETSSTREAPSSTGAGAAGGMPDLSSLAGMLGGSGGLGGMMNNPMFQQAAQQMMQNPDMLSNLMNNPMLQQMASQFGGSGSGLPDMSSLLNNPALRQMANDPAMRNMAQQFMGGAGSNGGGNSGGNSNGDSNADEQE